MGLFNKKERVDFNKASGSVLVLGISLPDRAMLGKQKLTIDHTHFILVNIGYILGMSMTFVTPQIGLNNVNKFIRSAMDNASKVLLPEFVREIPNIEKYSKNVSNFVLMESFDSNDDMFDKLTKKYLSDLYNDMGYSNSDYQIAKSDLIFYYKSLDKFINRLKIE